MNGALLSSASASSAGGHARRALIRDGRGVLKFTGDRAPIAQLDATSPADAQTIDLSHLTGLLADVRSGRESLM